MYLAGDIGGTKTHLTLYDGDKCLKEQKYPSKDYSDLESIITEFIQDQSPNDVIACFGIAGPVKEGRCKVTNLPWTVDVEIVKKKMGFQKVALLNDLETNAYGINVLKESDFYVLNKGNPKAQGNKALISAGTGLGEAGMYFDGKEDHPFACEGGHCDFAARNELEINLLEFLIGKFGHASFERVLSGQGMENIYDFLREEKIETPEPGLEEEMQGKDRAKVISDKALDKSSKICQKTLEVFVSLYGSEAGNVALKFFSLGGLYIGGGIAPKIIDYMKDKAFMKSFTSKGRFEALLSEMPVRIILNDSTSLLGALYYSRKNFPPS